MDLVYKNEKTLFTIMLIFSSLVWALLVIGTFGLALLYVLMFFIVYCFVQSAFVSYIKGTGVRITEEQFPDLKRQITQCCARLQIDEEPQAYLLQMGGTLNAFATRFLGRHFIVLYTDVVDGLADNPDALNFYIGHELGHIKRRHLTWARVLLPATVLPLVGAAYARAREYTCDRHGLAACGDPASAEQGLAVLAAGSRRARDLNKAAFVAQSYHCEGFWMSFHELVADYPWLIKRMAAVRALAAGQDVVQPRRHLGAKILAFFMPRIAGAGIVGGAVAVFIIGILAAVAIPAYDAYTKKAAANGAYNSGMKAVEQVGNYIETKGAFPETIEAAGLSANPGGEIERLQLDTTEATVEVYTRIESELGQGRLSFQPTLEEGKVSWKCTGHDMKTEFLPVPCR